MLKSLSQAFKRERKPKSKTRETVETFVVAIVLALGVRATVAEARFIPSESMLPTLEVGDRLIVEKVTYRLHAPERGDIVVFDPPPRSGFDRGNAFIKRIVGLPGETIAVREGQVYINDQPLNETYVMEPPTYEMDPLTIPAGNVFVMGDNRNNSADSHVWGALPIDNIIGRSAVRFWPPVRIGLTD
jgi:signal peptidase I